MVVPLINRRWLLEIYMRSRAESFGSQAARTRTPVVDPSRSEYARKILSIRERAYVEAELKLVKKLVYDATSDELDKLAKFELLPAGFDHAWLQPKPDWKSLDDWAIVHMPEYRRKVMAARLISRTATRAYLSPHTAIGQRRLMRNFNRLSAA